MDKTEGNAITVEPYYEVRIPGEIAYLRFFD